ncbi:MAG: hypothetical protein AAGU15_06655 [Anaerolineaceae bacterium]|jgi:hypothetical protein
MSTKRVLPLIIIVIALVLVAIFLVRDSQERKVMALVEQCGGWISLKDPFISNSFDHYNDPENWKETEQLIGQASLKFSSQSEFTCEWEPIHKIKNLIWLVTNCAEKLGDHYEYRTAYLLFRVGSTGLIESFYVPVGNDYVELVEPFVKGPEDNELSETRTGHIKLRLTSPDEIPPLVYESSGLLK